MIATLADLFLVFLVGMVLVNGFRQWRERRKMDRYMAALQDWGYYAGKLGKSPNFHMTEGPEIELDWADRLAISVGWQQGFDEYIAERERAKQ